MSLATLGQAVIVGLASGVFYAFLALAFTVIFALTRALNLAHGELIVLGGYVGFAAAQALGLPLPALVPLAALALVPLGLLWRALLHRVAEPIELNSLGLTFGLALALQTAMQAVWSADYRLIPTPGEAGAAPLVPGLATPRAAAALLGLIVFGVLQLLLTRTRLGAALRATSRDAETAALLGVNTDRVGIVSFAVAAAIAGAGGVLFGAVHYLHPAAGLELTLLGITLSIVGAAFRGTTLGGLLFGGLAIGLLESLTVAASGPQWRELVVAGLLLGVLLVRGPVAMERP
jgi:branched-chain amino acid transport system permease protein